MPSLGITNQNTFGGGSNAGGMSEIATLNVAGSRRSGARYIGGGPGNTSQQSGRSHSDNRSNIGVGPSNMGGSGQTVPSNMATNLQMAP